MLVLLELSEIKRVLKNPISNIDRILITWLHMYKLPDQYLSLFYSLLFTVGASIEWGDQVDSILGVRIPIP